VLNVAQAQIEELSQRLPRSGPAMPARLGDERPLASFLRERGCAIPPGHWPVGAVNEGYGRS